MIESPPHNNPCRKDRLIALIQVFRDGEVHLGRDLAKEHDVSARTIYRDMATLLKSGVPITGTPGSGYQMGPEITLPSMNLTMEELEILHLGIAVMAEASDPGLAKAARALAAKIDAALPEGKASLNTGWGLAVLPFADPGAGVQHMPLLRDAIRQQRKLRLGYRVSDGISEHVIQPLMLEYWGRVWTCLARIDETGAERGLRLDRIETLELHSAESPGS